MFPILFELGPITIYSYGLFLALAYVAGTFVFWREGKKQGYNEEKLLDLSIISLATALVGGHLYFVVLNWSLFADDPISILYVWQGGFAYHGALLFVLLISGYFVYRWKWPFFQIADIAALAATAALVLGKIGSFLAGFDFGRASDLPWAVQFPNLVGARHPAQIYEAAVYFSIFVILYYVYSKNLASPQMKSGKIFFAFLLLTSLSRAGLEFFRAQPFFIGPLPLATLISLVVAVLTIFALYYFQIRDFRSDSRAFLSSFLVLNKKLMRKLGI